MQGFTLRRITLALVLGSLFCGSQLNAAGPHEHHHEHGITFDVKSVKDGNWSDPQVWSTGKVPGGNQRVLISSGTEVRYDVEAKAVIRLIQVAGTLRFADDRNTELNVGIVKIQNSEVCTENGFACDLHSVNDVGEPHARVLGPVPALIVGEQNKPIPAKHTARIKLHFLDGFNKDDAPAIVCCSGRMDLHGSPLSRTWVKLGKSAKPEDKTVELAEAVIGWQVGDEILITGSEQQPRRGSYRKAPEKLHSEQRIITAIEGTTITLDKPLTNPHFGEGKRRSEVANLSRNVIIESADPQGERGHTMYHRYSHGGISYARFAHLGKENSLGRYPIHFHLIGDTMRGSSVLGAVVIDSHNRWVTVHGTQYLLVRDCIGFQSVGHGYFLEDGTETFNLLDRNLAVQAYRGKALPKQVLPFDPNDGGGFWWANGWNMLTRNVACENDEYGYRYDSQKRSNFNSFLPIRMPDGTEKVVDIRTLPILRFEGNESHTEGLYAVALAGTDGAGPDIEHPHIIRDLNIWETHYSLRAQIPTMLVEHVRIHSAAYGVYRPWFKDHVYRDIHIARTGAEPFNRGQDDDSLQHGRVTVDGLKFSEIGYGGQMPLIQISDDNFDGTAETHMRNVTVEDRTQNNRWPLVNLGGGPRPQPKTNGVPIYLHDYFGPGKHAKVVSTRAKDLLNDGNTYRPEPPLTGDESVVAEVENIEFPELLNPIDDIPPATVILSTRIENNQLHLTGVTFDNGTVTETRVNGELVQSLSQQHGVMDWQLTLPIPEDGKLTAKSRDDAGNEELTPHEVSLK